METRRRVSLYGSDFIAPSHHWPRSRHRLNRHNRRQKNPPTAARPHCPEAVQAGEDEVVQGDCTEGTMKISKSNQYNVWKRTRGLAPRMLPMDQTAQSIGDVRIHVYEDQIQAWVYQDIVGSHPPRMDWCVAHPGHAHPSRGEYVLKFRQNGDPSWVQRSTLAKDTRSQRKKRKAGAEEDAYDDEVETGCG